MAFSRALHTHTLPHTENLFQKIASHVYVRIQAQNAYDEEVYIIHLLVIIDYRYVNSNRIVRAYDQERWRESTREHQCRLRQWKSKGLFYLWHLFMSYETFLTERLSLYSCECVFFFCLPIDE